MNPHGPRPRWTIEEVSHMTRLWQEGYSNHAIAHEVGRPVLGVVSKLSRLGLRRPNGTIPDSRVEERNCLTCGRIFPSTGRFNRICTSCKNAHDWDNNDGFIRIGGGQGNTTLSEDKGQGHG